MTEPRRLKIIIVGNSTVGKTSLLRRFITGEFDLVPPTVGIAVDTVNVSIDDCEVVLAFHDTAGQEKFNALTQNFYRKSHGVVLVYDVTNMNTFLALEKWLQDIRTFCEFAPILIVGNKIDDPNMKPVNVTQIKRYAIGEDYEHIETSAKNGKNVKEAFYFLIRLILRYANIIEEGDEIEIKNISRDEVARQDEEATTDNDSSYSSYYYSIPSDDQSMVNRKPKKLSPERLKAIDKVLFGKDYEPEESKDKDVKQLAEISTQTEVQRSRCACVI